MEIGAIGLERCWYSKKRSFVGRSFSPVGVLRFVNNFRGWVNFRVCCLRMFVACVGLVGEFKIFVACRVDTIGTYFGRGAPGLNVVRFRDRSMRRVRWTMPLCLARIDLVAVVGRLVVTGKEIGCPPSVEILDLVELFRVVESVWGLLSLYVEEGWSR